MQYCSSMRARNVGLGVLVLSTQLLGLRWVYQLGVRDCAGSAGSGAAAGRPPPPNRQTPSIRSELYLAATMECRHISHILSPRPAEADPKRIGPCRARMLCRPDASVLNLTPVK